MPSSASSPIIQRRRRTGGRPQAAGVSYTVRAPASRSCSTRSRSCQQGSGPCLCRNRVCPAANLRREGDRCHPPVDDILALTSNQGLIVAVAPVDDVVTLATIDRCVVARPAVDDVVAAASEEVVVTAKAVYLVLAFHTLQVVWSVGAGEQAAVGATGYVVRGKVVAPLLDGPRPQDSGFFFGRRSF